MDETITVLVGAEGAAEGERAGWCRDATPEEAQRFREGDGRRVADLDGTGRPYWLMTLLPEAPPAVVERARANVRVLRLAPA